MNSLSISQPYEASFLAYGNEGAPACFHEIPVEAIAFAVAAAVSHLFGLPFSSPLLGMCAGLFACRLVLKILESYNAGTFVELSKRACKLNKNFPRLQLISFLFTLAAGAASHSIGFILGAALGGYGAIIMNVENYKLLQHAHRRTQKLSYTKF